jgi:hypothetical protein
MSILYILAPEGPFLASVATPDPFPVLFARTLPGAADMVNKVITLYFSLRERISVPVE